MYWRRLTKMAKKVSMKLVNGALSKNTVFKSEMRKKILRTVETSKQMLIQEFASHPVTQEIEGGPTNSNLSGTLGGYGNLFSFIGFPFSTRPTQVVRDLLRSIQTGKVRRTRSSAASVNVEINVNMPTKEDFVAATPFPFESGRSWLYGIETGISGFGSYFFKKWKNSRSSTAFQNKKKIRSGGFKNTSYFSSMLVAFTKRIR